MMRFRRSTLLVAFASSRRYVCSAFTVHKSFAELIDRYDGFILDQFGVLHDGTQALPGAVDCIEELYRANKSLIVLSNTSAPSKAAMKRLPKFGFEPLHFRGAVTSGEEAAKHIVKTYGSGATPSKAVFMTWDTSNEDNPRLTAHPQVFLQACGNIQLAASVEDADFVIFHGSEVWNKGEENQESLSPFIEEGNLHAVDPLLEKCLAHNLPAVCANPDFIVRTPMGGSAHMPGKLAARYQDLGGSCTTFGKPAIEHFEACIEKLDLAKRRVAHVGDSLHHDVGGAMRAGIPTVFVCSGIHANDLEIEFGQLPDSSTLEKVFESQKAIPTHVVSAFRI